MKRASFILLCLMGMAGCASLPSSSDMAGWMESRGIREPADDGFSHCRGYGCRIVERLSFTPEDWAQVEAPFKPPPSDAAAEREAVGKAIGAFERRAGLQAGTLGDIAGTFGRVGDFQQDCIDESTNTSVFLTILAQRGLLRFHEVRTPAGRFPVMAGSFWPHHTAVMAERTTGEAFAVDSWFENGGRPAHVVPLSLWTQGWKP
jgi:hypothetical protein